MESQHGLEELPDISDTTKRRKMMIPVRKFLGLWFFITCFAFMALLTPVCSLSMNIASDVVEAYCQFDADGYRILSGYYAKIRNLMAWEKDQDEPGWDCFKIISDYKIINVSSTNETATVTVQYDIVGNLCGIELDRKSYLDVVDFKLINTDKTWKIREYVPYPRISIDAAIVFLQNWAKNLERAGRQNDEKISELKDLIIELERLRE